MMSESEMLEAVTQHMLQDKTKKRAERVMMFWDSLDPWQRMSHQRDVDPYYTNEIARPRRGRY